MFVCLGVLFCLRNHSAIASNWEQRHHLNCSGSVRQTSTGCTTVCYGKLVNVFVLDRWVCVEAKRKWGREEDRGQEPEDWEGRHCWRSESLQCYWKYVCVWVLVFLSSGSLFIQRDSFQDASNLCSLLGGFVVIPTAMLFSEISTFTSSSSLLIVLARRFIPQQAL